MKFGIKEKLFALTGVTLLMFMSATIFAIVKVDGLKEQVEFLGLERIPLSRILGDIRTASNAVPRFTWLALELPPGSQERSDALVKVHGAVNLLVESAEKYSQFQITSDEKNIIDQTIPLTKDIGNIILEATKLLELNNAASDTSVRKFLIKSMPPVAVKVTQNMETLAKIANEKNNYTILQIKIS